MHGEFHQVKQICVLCLLRLVHAEATSPNGSTTHHQRDVKILFMVDAKGMKIYLRLENFVRVPVYVVSFICRLYSYQL